MMVNINNSPMAVSVTDPMRFHVESNALLLILDKKLFIWGLMSTSLPSIEDISTT